MKLLERLMVWVLRWELWIEKAMIRELESGLRDGTWFETVEKLEPHYDRRDAIRQRLFELTGSRTGQGIGSG